MTPYDLDAFIAQLKAHDAERTQDEWRREINAQSCNALRRGCSASWDFMPASDALAMVEIASAAITPTPGDGR